MVGQSLRKPPHPPYQSLVFVPMNRDQGSGFGGTPPGTRKNFWNPKTP